MYEKTSNVKNKKNKKGKVKIFTKKKTEDIDKIIEDLQSAYDTINPKDITTFTDIPLSPKTLKGLNSSNYVNPTDIQKESIGFALKGKDILGAAKTGSGKTLAFLIPVLETLFCKKWSRLDGTGALIITPTRELAYQIFETLRKVGFYHDFSAGLIIGGKDLKFERKRMDQCNIVICTPGRLLQHMDENPLFDCANLQILILDEADRILDFGFEETMNSIIENLPSARQTLLFSATQTKSVRDLARLSLSNPKYISVHEHSAHSTPEGLIQSYIVCELEDKISFLWSFIRSHSKQKILVFLASCNQVKYVFEIFCQLRPSIALLPLHGKLHQLKRMDVYNSFSNKEHVVLFATDIAARGLDFPAVNWVIQVDCPEDANTYIHRVGRTARYHKGGEAVLVLLPSEKDSMIAKLEQKKIPISEIKVNPSKLQSPKVKMEATLAKKTDLKASAQRAFVSYIKSVFLMKDKTIFDVSKLDTDAFARSLGLVISPRIRFLQKHQKYNTKKEDNSNKPLVSQFNGVKKVRELEEGKREDVDDDESSAQEEESEDDDESNSKTKQQYSISDKRKSLTKPLQTFNFGADDSDSDEAAILSIKRADHKLDDDDDDGRDVESFEGDIEQGRKKKKPLSKAAQAKKILRKNIVPNKKIIFTEEGEAVEDRFKQRVTDLGKKYEDDNVGGGINLEEAHRVLREEDKIDKQLFRERIKMKHKEKRMKLRKLRKNESSEEEEEGAEEDEQSGFEEEDSESQSSAVDDDKASENDEDVTPSDLSASLKDTDRSLKRKGRKRKYETSDEEENDRNTRSSIVKDEELVLQLLAKK